MAGSEALAHPIIAINALSAVSGGGLSVARGLSKSLGESRPNWNFLVLASHEQALPESPPANVEIVRYPSALSPWKRWTFEQLVLPRILSRRGVDLMLLLGGFKVFTSRVPQASVWQNAHIWTPPVATHTASLTAYIAVQRLVMRATLPRVRTNIFLSKDSANRCMATLDIPGITIDTAPIGLDDVFLSQPSPAPLVDRDPVLLCVGDIYSHKRFELAIDALSHLEHGVFPLELWIAGRIIDRRCYERLVALVGHAGLQGRVRFLGHVERSRLIELYRSSAVFITSTRLETFGLTPIEAMSCGVPVVACRESAVPEVCDAAACYADASGPAIAQAVAHLLNNPGEWASFQQRGIERTRSFAWPIVAERYAQILQVLLEKDAE